MRRTDVASTLVRTHFDLMCLLGWRRFHLFLNADNEFVSGVVQVKNMLKYLEVLFMAVLIQCAPGKIIPPGTQR